MEFKKKIHMNISFGSDTQKYVIILHKIDMKNKEIWLV